RAGRRGSLPRRRRWWWPSTLLVDDAQLAHRRLLLGDRCDLGGGAPAQVALALRGQAQRVHPQALLAERQQVIPARQLADRRDVGGPVLAGDRIPAPGVVHARGAR